MMSDPNGRSRPVSKQAAACVRRDVADPALFSLNEGERLWKVYVFRSAVSNDTGLEHRIYTTIKPGGRLALVTFVSHTPAPKQTVRSGIARVPDLPVDALDRIITAIQRETQIPPEAYEEIDLSHLPTLEEQLDYLDGIQSSRQ